MEAHSQALRDPNTDHYNILRVDTSTSNYGIDCVWFTYICFSMEKDIVFACLYIICYGYFLQKDPKYENENA